MNKNIIRFLLLLIISIIVLFFLSIFFNSNLRESLSIEDGYTIVRILPDGSVDPPINSIRKDGTVYTFADNFYGQIIVDANDVVIDGDDFTLQGQYTGNRTDSWVVGQGPDQNTSSIPWTIGIDLARPILHNLTVKNLKICNFYIGMYIWTSNNTLTQNSISDSIVGILLSGDSNTMTKNTIANNEEGIFFGVNTPGNEPLNIVLNQNNFVDNVVQFSGCFCENYDPEEAIHTWDDGQRGNFWSDYQGIDDDDDGIGDTPYVIDILNQDRYPLMEPIIGR